MVVAVLSLSSAAGFAAVPAEASAAPPVESLVYQGAEVQTQVDVNGAAAVMLIGKALDTIAAQTQKQMAAMQAAPAGTQLAALQGKASVISAALPMIDPVKEAIKSLEHITILIMKPGAEVNAADFMKFYSGSMSAQGWTSLISVRDKSGPAVVTMLAPEAKGIFLAVNDKRQLLVAFVTTTHPIGDLISQVIQAGGDAFPQVMGQLMTRRAVPVEEPPAPAPQPKPKPKSKTSSQHK